MWKLSRAIGKSLRNTKNPSINNLKKTTMFEKKEKRKTLLDILPSSYEEVLDYPSKSKKANRVYYVDTDKMYSLNPIGVVKNIESHEYITTLNHPTTKELLFMGKIKLFIDSNAQNDSNMLPEELMVKPEQDGDTEKEE